eukprot:1136487-Pelagomonas_calceolata.AAC.3
MKALNILKLSSSRRPSNSDASDGGLSDFSSWGGSPQFSNMQGSSSSPSWPVALHKDAHEGGGLACNDEVGCMGKHLDFAYSCPAVPDFEPLGTCAFEGAARAICALRSEEELRGSRKLSHRRLGSHAQCRLVEVHAKTLRGVSTVSTLNLAFSSLVSTVSPASIMQSCQRMDQVHGEAALYWQLQPCVCAIPGQNL